LTAGINIYRNSDQIVKKESDDINVIIVGPKAPPYGGIATFVEHIQANATIKHKGEIWHYRTGKKSKNTPNCIQSLIEIVLIGKFPLSQKFRESDIIHIHTASGLSYYRNAAYAIIGHLFGKKIIFHIHGAAFHDFYNNATPFMKRAIAHIIKTCDKIVVTSKSWIPTIKQIGCDVECIRVIPNGYDQKVFYQIDKSGARNKLGIPFDRKILITIANLESYKGHKYLIEAMETIIKKRNDVVLYIIGNGSLEGDLKEQTQQAHLTNHVIFTGGNKPSEELPLWLGSCDLFVLPSLNEGNPIVMFECLGSGKPFIGTIVGGVPDIITSEDYGLLVKPANPQELAETILKGLELEWNHDKIISYAEQFTWGKITEKVIDIYHETVNH
jgi:glycosyltransferase involved in cell wall biosynthesis